MKNPSISSIFYKIVSEFEIKISKNQINKELDKYHFLPNIEEIYKILNSWNIKNLTVNNIPLEDLIEAPLPILSFNKDRELFIVCNISVDCYVCYLQGSENKVVLNTEEFSKLSNGIYILLEADENSGLMNSKQKEENRKKENIAKSLIIIGLIFLILYGFFDINQNVLSLYIVNVFGLILSIYLLLKEYSFFSNELFDLCKIGKKFSCDNVINSQASKFLGFSLSEISTSFFLFIILLIIYSSVTNTPLNYISIFLYLSGISIIYSIYQQYKMKQYCVICIVISFILILAISFSGSNYGFHINISNLIHSIFPLSITLLTIGLSKNYLYYNEEYRKNDANLTSLIESSLLANNFKDKRIYNRNFSNEIQVGFNQAPYSIILFLNPTCPRCKSVLKNLERLFSELENQVHLRILYSGPKEDNADAKLMFAVLYEKLKLWTDDEKIDFLTNQIINIKETSLQKFYDREVLDSLTDQYNWSNDLELESTPAIILNNIVLPSFFGIEEICVVLRNTKS